MRFRQATKNWTCMSGAQYMRQAAEAEKRVAEMIEEYRKRGAVVIGDSVILEGEQPKEKKND